jgi:hypothetical protein
MRFFLPDKDGTVNAIAIDPGIMEAPFPGELAVQVHPAHRVAPPPDSFEYMGYVSAHGKTPEEAWSYLETAYHAVSFDIR